MATEKFTALTDRSSILTTELNALANGSYSAASSALANQTNRDRYGTAELTVTFGSAPTADSTVDLFYVQAPDASNYEDGGGAVRPNPRNFLGSFPLRAVTTAQRVVTDRFELPPASVKFVAYNASGQAFPASGSIIKLYTFNRDIS